MKYVEIAQDGNCLFNSISYAIAYDYRHGKKLRKFAVDHVKNNIDKYKDYIFKNVDTYLKNMYQEGEYGDEIMLNAISEILSIKITVYDKYNHKIISVYDNSNNNKNKKNINIFYDKHILHYDCIVDIMDNNTNILKKNTNEEEIHTNEE